MDRNTFRKRPKLVVENQRGGEEIVPLPQDFKVQVKRPVVETDIVNDGVYTVKIKDISDLGEVEGQWGAKHMLSFLFEITSGAEKGKKVGKWVSNSWSVGGRYPPSNLFLIASAVYGKEELKATEPIDLNTLTDGKLNIVVKKVIVNDVERSRVTDFLTSEKK